MKNINWANVEEAQGFEKVTPGGYICRITSAVDVPEKEYLKIEYDIADGKLKGFYAKLNESKGFWAGKFIKSYKETAQSFFKAFLTAVEKSNSGFKFNNDETKLVGKFVGLVLAEEEYIGNDGSEKRRLYVSEVRSIEAIKKGDFEVPALKELTQTGNKPNPASASSDGFMQIPDSIDEELPFN